MKFTIVLLSLFAILSCNQPPAEKKIGNEIAVANGVDNFNKVEMLEFTFNVQRDTAKAASRHWQWFPKSNEVVFITDSGNTRFKRSDTSTQNVKSLNAKFTNDEYWLIYPFHLKWDNGFDMRDSSMQMAPISGKSMHKITTKYNDKDGYTPGDMYDVFVDDKNRIQEWAYHRTGSPEPSLVTTWEDYKDFNGLQLSQEHKTKDGKFHLWLSNIVVK